MRESREEMIALRGEFERIKAFLRVADSLEEGDGEVKIWIKQIREVTYDAEDALDEFKLLLTHNHEGCGLLYKIPCQWLVGGDSEQEVISVVGMGGLGKTTLAKQVFDDPVVKKHFPVCAWVTLSPSSKTEELLMDMLQQIASSLMEPVPSGTDTMNINWLKRTIKSLLQGRKSRYLIVLDDVWHMDRWDAVKYALPNNNLGSRIMITTRNSDLALASCTELNGKVYEMQPLPVEQSPELLLNC